MESGGSSGTVKNARAIGSRGGVCSAGAILDAVVGDRSWERDVIEYNQVSSTKVVVGEAGAAIVPTVGIVLGEFGR
ncbi:hypothetical protein V6N12_043028 [Hibiscus sabdariffa]|uniref:Uncharacterized protein n=1 Tax=Hibiscus sabdariffa TaxID=183260 RepID=A0ABR2DI14_9ROSI